MQENEGRMIEYYSDYSAYEYDPCVPGSGKKFSEKFGIDFSDAGFLQKI
ncbi:MAG: hypothetical protein Q4B37_07610 [Eubacteriales bacterium]|nr:hypothetical protein [Eubacteriales bacterium]